MREKYLPIGTVVLLKEGTKKVMITGYASMSPETGDRLFDYSGCTYPEGFLSYDKICVFNGDQISEVFYNGYQNEEYEEFEKVVEEKVKEYLAQKNA